MSRKLPEANPILSLKTDFEVFVVKYNVDGNYIMSGHSDRTVRVC